MSRVAASCTALVLLACGTGLAACGSSDDSSSAGATGSASSGAGGTRTAAFTKFRQCLADHGVTLPDRPQGAPGYGPPPTGTDGAPPAGGAPGGPGALPGGPAGGDATTRAGLQACAKLRPQGAGPGGRGARPRQPIAAFRPYLRCLQGQGLDVKVADGFNALRDLRRDDPKVQAALTTCQSKLPRPAAPAGTPTTTTTTT